MLTVTHLPQVLALFLFVVGMLIVLLRRNTIVLLMGIELMLNAANLSLVAFARGQGQIDGQIMVFFVITIAAAESAVGLSILVNLYRNFGAVTTDRAQTLQG
jgi:NADH-quinone oxidoreductase subunit K